VLVFTAILPVDLVSGLLGQCAMNPDLLFHTNIDLTRELSGSIREPWALVLSDAVEFPLMLPLTPYDPMTTIHAPVCPSSSAESGAERGRLVLRLFTIEGALALDLISISWGSKVFGKVGACIFRTPGCLMLW